MAFKKVVKNYSNYSLYKNKTGIAYQQRLDDLLE